MTAIGTVIKYVLYVRTRDVLSRTGTISRAVMLRADRPASACAALAARYVNAPDRLERPRSLSHTSAATHTHTRFLGHFLAHSP